MTALQSQLEDRISPPAGSDARRADEIGADDLRDLMEQVNATAEQLSRTHVMLEREVTRLRRDLEEANSQLRRSRSLAALGEMAAGIAHEIRNPIAAIQLTAQTLSDDVAENADQTALCEKICRAVDTADAIVRDVLLFAREMAIRPTSMSARELLEHAAAGCEAITTHGGVAVTFDTPSGTPACRLEVDPALMTQAIGNVIRNAVEAMTEAETPRRELRMSAAVDRVRGPDGQTEERVVLAFEDTGPGIPPEVVERMFNPFFTTRHTGTGLGLAIVHRIVDAHGGQVQVRRANAGGARVDLCLPPTQPRPKANPKPDPKPNDGLAGVLPSDQTSQETVVQ